MIFTKFLLLNPIYMIKAEFFESQLNFLIKNFIHKLYKKYFKLLLFVI